MIAALMTALTVVTALVPWMDASDPLYVRITPMYPYGLFMMWATCRWLAAAFTYPGRRNR